jgi:hypothetical protein
MIAYIKRLFRRSPSADEAKDATFEGWRCTAKKMLEDIDADILKAASLGRSYCSVFTDGYPQLVLDEVVNNLKKRGYDVTIFESGRLGISW